MKTSDRDIGWMHTKPMLFCLCGHREKSHRPMSRTCTLCDCASFTQEPARKKETIRSN